MKFSVKGTLKVSSLGGLGFVGPGLYDTESPNFPPSLKEALIAEVEDPRGIVVITDHRDYKNIPVPVLKDLTGEELDDISSGAGKTEDSEPPLGNRVVDEESTADTSAASPSSKSTRVTKPAVKKIQKTENKK